MKHPPRELFRRYAGERRHADLPGYRREALDGVVRYTPVKPDLEGIVMFAALAEACAGYAIAAQVGHFARLGLGFEWKVYDFDAPSDLAQRLERHGFERGVSEAFMLRPAGARRARRTDPEVRVEKVNSQAAIRDIVRIQEGVWDDSFPWLEASLAENPERTAIYCAYAGGQPVGTGWIEFPAGSRFAEIHGGAVIPEYRGRGIYRALFEQRVIEAQRRGYAFIAVDAAPMSRPILLRQGFQYVCETVPMRWRA